MDASKYTEPQSTLSGNGVHSIMKEKSAQPGEGWGFMPTPFNYIYHHVYKVIVYAPAEGRYTHHISTPTPYSLCGT